MQQERDLSSKIFTSWSYWTNIANLDTGTFFKMLGQNLQSSRSNVFHAEGNADLRIVQKAIESSETSDITVIGDDTDLLAGSFALLRKKSKSTRYLFSSRTEKFSQKKVQKYQYSHSYAGSLC